MCRKELPGRINQKKEEEKKLVTQRTGGMVTKGKQNYISVCICTFKRPGMLARALRETLSQEARGRFSFEIIVVDNDFKRSAEEAVKNIGKEAERKILYECEPEQNIALARNRAVANAKGNYIAFIDDDEYPQKDWLSNMHSCLLKYRADAVLGPVLPEFPPGAPLWLKKSGLCERNRSTTGSLVNQNLRTGNILLRSNIFEEDSEWFDPSTGLTGGEDGKFLRRQLVKGRKFVWCDEAPVFETVPRERWSVLFYLRKMIRIGTLVGEEFRRRRAYGKIVKATALLVGYLSLVPMTLPASKHIWIRPLSKLSFYIGQILGVIGLSHFKYRS